MNTITAEAVASPSCILATATVSVRYQRTWERQAFFDRVEPVIVFSLGEETVTYAPDPDDIGLRVVPIEDGGSHLVGGDLPRLGEDGTIYQRRGAGRWPASIVLPRGTAAAHAVRRFRGPECWRDLPASEMRWVGLRRSATGMCWIWGIAESDLPHGTIASIDAIVTYGKCIDYIGSRVLPRPCDDIPLHHGRHSDTRWWRSIRQDVMALGDGEVVDLLQLPVRTAPTARQRSRARRNRRGW